MYTKETVVRVTDEKTKFAFCIQFFMPLHLITYSQTRKTGLSFFSQYENNCKVPK